jgi:GAF domain-containing protein
MAALSVRAGQQAFVAEVGQLALSPIALAKLVDRTVEHIARLLKTASCTILELPPDGTALLFGAGIGWKPDLLRHAMIPVEDDSHAGYTLRSHEPVIIADLPAETRFDGSALLCDHLIMSVA